MHSEKKIAEALFNLPHGDSTWFLTLRRLENQSELLPETIDERWVFICLDIKTQAIISLEIYHHQPDCHQILEFLTEAIENPIAAEKSALRRPLQLQTDLPFLSNCLSSIHTEAQILVIQQEPDSTIKIFIKHLLETLSLSPPTLPGLFSVSGITDHNLIDLCINASQFYKTKPWDILSIDQIVKIIIDPPRKSYYVQIMGEANLEYGILVFQDKDDLRQFYQFSHDPLAHFPINGWFSLTYTTKDLIPEEDYLTFKDLNCQIASNSAYPFPMVYSSETMRRPDIDELRIIQLILRVLNTILEKQIFLVNQNQYPSAEHKMSFEEDDQLFHIKIFFETIPTIINNPLSE
jgi:hypothetical protein